MTELFPGVKFSPYLILSKLDAGGHAPLLGDSNELFYWSVKRELMARRFLFMAEYRSRARRKTGSR
jgi:hypothetical protein